MNSMQPITFTEWPRPLVKPYGRIDNAGLAATGRDKEPDLAKQNSLASKTFRVPKTAELIANHIRASIIRGELKAGDNLPLESQLIEQFAASRPTIREAHRVLETEQFIVVKRGGRKGAVVQKPSAEMLARYAGYVLQVEGATLEEIYQARYALEPYAARLLAEKPNARMVARLGKEVDRLESLLADGHMDAFRQSATHFYQLLVESSGNRTLGVLAMVLERLFARHQLRYEKPRGVIDDAELRARALMWLKRLRKLLALIESGNGVAAEKHWRATLDRVKNTWLTGFEGTTAIDLLD